MWHTFESLFRNFGLLIESAKLICKPYGSDDEVLSLLAKYGSKPESALNELHVEHIRVDCLGERMEPVFKRLKIFTVKSSLTASIKLGNFLNIANELTTLHVEGGTQMPALMKKFDKLEEVHLIDIWDMKDHSLDRFLSMNPRIKRLSITDQGDLSSQMYSSIARHLPQLQELRFDRSARFPEKNADKNLAKLANLKHLKVLQLFCLSLSVTRLFDALAKGRS